MLAFADVEMGTVTDYDGNVYNTVKYNGLEWMVENLRVTHYNDGTAIPTRSDLLKAPGSAEDFAVYYKFPNNDTNNVANYGLLYSWNVAFNHEGNPPTNPTETNLCPSGWHIPTRSEWATLGTASYSSDILTITNLPSWFNTQFAGDFNTSGITQFGIQARFWTPELMMPGSGYGCKYLYITSSAASTVLQSNYRNNNCMSIRCVRAITTANINLDKSSGLKINLSSTNDYFTIGGLTQEELLSIYDISGKIRYSKLVDNDENISISDLSKGIYIIKLGNETAKLIKK